MKVTYDATVRAAYVRLSGRPIRVTRRISDSVLIDLDVRDNVVGVELLNVDAPIIEVATGGEGDGRGTER